MGKHIAQGRILTDAPQRLQETATSRSMTVPASSQKMHTAPKQAFVRRGYLIVFDQIQPGDVLMPPPKNQPANDPRCPRIIQPVPNKPPRIRRGYNIDISK